MMKVHDNRLISLERRVMAWLPYVSLALLFYILLTVNQGNRSLEQLKEQQRDVERIERVERVTLVKTEPEPKKQPPVAYNWHEVDIGGKSMWIATEPDYDSNLSTSDELMVSQTFKVALANGACKDRKNYVIDIGANAGYFGLMSLTLGCNVHFFEPQPGCNFLIANQVQANGFQDWATIHMNFAASDDTASTTANGSPSTISVGRTGCHVGFISKQTEVTNKEWGAKDTVDMFAKTAILGVSLDTAVLGEHSTIPVDAEILLVKIDTEGSEVFIGRGMQKLIKSGRVHAFTIEISAPFEREFGLTTDDTTQLTLDFIKNGYTPYMLSSTDGTVMASIPKHNTPIGNLAQFPGDRESIKAIWDERLARVVGSNVWFISEKGKRSIGWTN